MLNQFRRMLSRLANVSRPQTTNISRPVLPLDADPCMSGLRDAVKRGWYRSATGELFVGFKVTKDDIVLDVGCGDGGATLFCAKQGAHIVFSDINEHKIKALMEKADKSDARKVEGFVSDSVPLPLPDEYATKILSMEMLEHTEDPEKIMSELVRVGKRGAQYLITVPDSRSEMLQKPFAAPDYFLKPNHIQIFDKERFLRLVENSGLKVERYDSWGFYWTIYMSLFWIVGQDKRMSFKGAIVDKIGSANHPVLQSWANTWAGLLELDGSERLLESFDQYLPKAQIIIARKS